jgi:hypothetical protein
MKGVGENKRQEVTAYGMALIHNNLNVEEPKETKQRNIG